MISTQKLKCIIKKTENRGYRKLLITFYLRLRVIGNINTINKWSMTKGKFRFCTGEKKLL